MAISQSTLRNKARSYGAYSRDTIIIANEKRSSQIRTAFLCHSHKDQELVKGLVVLFREQGVELYVDWADKSMPDKPNSETALKIRQRIVQAKSFLYLATNNSKNSKWCPWEIGYADASNKEIFIIPTHDGCSTYGNEYLDLYPRIEEGQSETIEKDGYAVFNPNMQRGVWVENKLQ